MDWKVDFKYYPQFDWFEEYSGTTAAEFEKAAREEAERAAEERKKRQKRIGATDTLKDLARYVAEELKSAEAEIDPLS